MSPVTPPDETPEQPNADALPKRTSNAEQEGASVVIQEEQSLFAGPLPHPRLYREYDEIRPGAAERILRMAEKEQDSLHRDRRSRRRADAFRTFGAILVSLSLVGGGVLVAWLGYPWSSIPFAVALAVSPFLGRAKD